MVINKRPKTPYSDEDDDEDVNGESGDRVKGNASFNETSAFY